MAHLACNPCDCSPPQSSPPARHSLCRTRSAGSAWRSRRCPCRAPGSPPPRWLRPRSALPRPTACRGSGRGRRQTWRMVRTGNCCGSLAGAALPVSNRHISPPAMQRPVAAHLFVESGIPWRYSSGNRRSRNTGYPSSDSRWKAASLVVSSCTHTRGQGSGPVELWSRGRAVEHLQRREFCWSGRAGHQTAGRHTAAAGAGGAPWCGSARRCG